jgi:hypothetical protein
LGSATVSVAPVGVSPAEMTNNQFSMTNSQCLSSRCQSRQAATKGFEQEQTEETENETKSRKNFVENAQFWWIAQRSQGAQSREGKIMEGKIIL